jgi:hypothetical protein
MILRRRNLLALFVVEVVLFVLAGVTSKPGSTVCRGVSSGAEL